MEETPTTESHCPSKYMGPAWQFNHPVLRSFGATCLQKAKPPVLVSFLQPARGDGNGLAERGEGRVQTQGLGVLFA